MNKPGKGWGFGGGRNKGAAASLGAGEVSFAGSEPQEVDVPADVVGAIEPTYSEADPDGEPEASVADGEAVEVSGRSGRLFQRGAVEADEAADTKSRKRKGPKVKAEKPEKVKKVKAAKEEAEGISVPTNVAVDFYRGMTKPREAEPIARAFIEKNFDAPNASYIYMQPWRDGIAVEMQEGGGKAYLPEVLAMLDENPDALCILPMPNRVLQVRLDSETGLLEAMALTANQAPLEESFAALPTAPMTPFDRRGSKIFLIGLAMLVIATMSLLFSIGAFFLDTKAWALPHVQQTRVSDLPSAQGEKIKAALAQGDCVAKMEYLDGRWNIVGGWDNGSGVCTSVRPVTAGEGMGMGTDPSLEGPIPGADAGVPPGPPTTGGAPMAPPPGAAGPGVRAPGGPMPSMPGGSAPAPGSAAPMPGGPAPMPGGAPPRP